MTKLLQNKSLIKFLGIALSILLIVALVPQINVAYGSKDDVAGEDVAAETQTNDETDLAATGDTENGEEVTGETYTDENGVEMVSHKIETPEDDSDDPAAVATPASQAGEQTTPKARKAARVQARTVLDPNEETITIGEDTNYTSSPLTFNGGTHTLTINEGCTFTGDILIEGGAQVTINGKGTIQGTGTQSVIRVQGQNSQLILGEINQDGSFEGPTIKGGIGSASPSDYNDGEGTVGGGIFVNDKASIVMNGGTISNNTAGGGGGIFVWTNCGFTMNGGEISNNTATTHEGGGIFTNGKNGHITKGKIVSNHTNTTTDWGGGGIYINNDGSLKIDSARITKNTASGLGGGIAGCPHAKIAIKEKETTSIGEIKSSAFVYENTAIGDVYPNNTVLRFNTPKAIEDQSKKAPSGDFLVKGVTESDIATLQSGVNGGNIENGKITYLTWDSPRQKYTLENGAYASDRFKVALAQDYYCTLASYISATDLAGDEGEGENGAAIAWRGCKVGLPITTVPDTNINQDGLSYEENEFLVGQAIEVHDATLCLTSTANGIGANPEPSVTIMNNTSGTHGGGISCNGAVGFGSSTGTKTTVMPYAISLNKKIVNSLGDDVAISPNDKFKFELIDQETEDRYPAITSDDGVLNFTQLPGFDSEGPKIKKFILKENLTEPQKREGFDPSLEEGIEIEVNLNTKKSEVSYTDATYITYTTTVNSVKKITKGGNGNNTGEDLKEVVNTLKLKTSDQIKVTKIAEGIPGENTFSFNLKKIGNINSVVDNVDDPATLNADLASLASDATVVQSVTTEDSVTEQKQGVAKFDLGKFEKPGTHWYAIAEAKGEIEDISYDDTVYLVKVDVTLSDDGRSLETTKTTWKSEAGSKELTPVGDNKIEFKNVGIKYYSFGFDLTKQILTTLDKPLNFGDDRSFAFELRDENGNAVASVENVKPDAEDEDQSKAKIHFDLGEDYVKKAYANGGDDTLNFTLVEVNAGEKNMAYIPKDGIPVTVTVKTKAARYPVEKPTELKVEADSVTVKVDGQDDTTITNRYTTNGEWKLEISKHFYGLGDPQACSFTMYELSAIPHEGELILPVQDTLNSIGTVKLDRESNPEKYAEYLANGEVALEFPAIEYKAQDEDFIREHYYLISENDPEGAYDTTVYVVKVTVGEDPDNPGNLKTDHKVIGYADDLDSPLVAFSELAEETPVVEFYNSDTFGMVSAASYSVYAASGEPADQVCYVDPKIHKNLEGRAIKSGEFAFKLIEVNSYTDTEGTQISATVNDEFGMVDFDKANPVNGDLENPSCLAYTKPGTYYYRVIEDTSKGGMKDQSVLYSDQIITFTTVIEQDEATGQLQCTDMYYGYWDAAAGKNVRFDEQYLDYDKQPDNIGDMAKLDPDWHPTITNKARPMDLQVRKTSVTDRNEGLVGATYALYMVNGNAQGDIYLTEATSEEGGWITYKNVSLSTNNLYYFKETAAPAGHTVSEFRSPYFYLVEDASSANGYALKYTDTKTLPAADAAAQPAALAETGAEAEPMAAAAQAEAQAAANETATDPNAQPGYSADGSILLTYDKDGGVADEATELQVSKLDTRTHEWVEGAELLILEKDTGKEIARWTSGKAPEKLQKTLNVGTTYILREFKAPKDYRLANDVEFVIDNYGNVSITKGTENGNAELSDNTINLYDTMMDAEEVVTQQREKTREVPTADTLLAKTGDMLPLLGIGIVALAALVVLAIAIRRRRAEKGDDTQA
ncbi:Spy0128 family protein [Parvibacter caecicola]|uniref:Spy0128 family protein n=1 Tax=Parvibacter caecicola TaxID=747645 RepID=UPI0027317481|nr:FctA domain-containing protein [Parvibacter caecicola]